MDEKPAPKTSRYGKHSKRYWVVMYVIAAAIVYGLIYLLFIRKTGGAASGGFHY